MFLGFNETSTQSPANANAGIYHNDNTGTVVRYKTEVPPSEIYSGLKINPGEVKIIVDSCLYRNSDRMTTLEGTFPSHKEAFGFYLLNPKHVDESSKSHYFFHSVIIFTPKPGLFSETNPK